MRIDRFKRFQSGLVLADLYPSIQGVCACGCGKHLTGRKKKWASEECCTYAYIEYAILKGDTGVIRSNLYALQQGYCQICGVQSETWHADHIIPVHQGGGGCTLDNFQTLCEDCHKIKTKEDAIKYSLGHRESRYLF